MLDNHLQILYNHDMVIFFQILIVLGVLFFGVIIVVGIKAMIEDFKNPSQISETKFQEWIRTKEHGETFSEWKSKNYPNE